eukprot:RCo039052
MADDDLDSGVAVTPELMRIASGQFDLAVVQDLSLRGLGLSRLQGLHELTSLTSLDLSHNLLSHVEGLESLGPRLTRLDLQHNRLSSLEGLQGLTSLQTLLLQGNALASLAAAETALAALPALRVLYLQNRDGSGANPVCKEPTYQAAVRKRLAKLACLDGQYFLKDGLELSELRQRVCDVEPPQVVLPPSVPWIPDEDSYWDNVCLPEPKPGAAPVASRPEVQFKAAMFECQALLAKADSALQSAAKLEKAP